MLQKLGGSKMADLKKYYYLKLKDNFFDSEEIRILESMPNGIYYSNLLIKLYLKSLKFNGALRFNEYIPYDENMIATITNLNIDIVRSGLMALAALKLIERLDDGTIYMINIQSFIGKSNSEADRKRLYREKIEEQKQLLGQKTEDCTLEEGTVLDKCPIDIRTNGGTLIEKRPPEIEKEIEIELDKEIETDKDIESESDINMELAIDTALEASTSSRASIDMSKIHSQSVSLLKSFERKTGLSGRLNLEAVKRAVECHGIKHVEKAMGIALKRNKPTMIYINGILKNWAKEGYPKEGEENGNGCTGKDIGAGSGEFSGFKPREPKTLRTEERRALEQELL
jgi:predicted phage replisome organizer